METLLQLSFVFNAPVQQHEVRQRPSWRVRALSKRYRLTPPHAAIYALEMGLPVGGLR
jgi:hypothetical protein